MAYLFHKSRPALELFLIISAVLIFFGNRLHAANSYDLNLPVNEAKYVVEKWGKNNGYNILTDEKKDSVLLSASTNTSKIDIILIINSPTACIMKIDSNPAGTQEAGRIVEYVQEYQRRTSLKKQQPAKSTLESRIEKIFQNIVCITAVESGQGVNLTGFVIDDNGLILCTAHYLGSRSEITIFTSRGKTCRGTLIKLNKKSDLALIDCDMKFGSAVDILKGMPFLKNGQALSSMGCSEGELPKLIIGTVSGSPRKVEGQILWQAKMNVEPGDSGSPVFTESGDFAGVVRGRLRTAHDYTYIIPLDTVISFIREGQSK